MRFSTYAALILGFGTFTTNANAQQWYGDFTGSPRAAGPQEACVAQFEHIRGPRASYPGIRLARVEVWQNGGRLRSSCEWRRKRTFGGVEDSWFTTTYGKMLCAPHTSLFGGQCVPRTFPVEEDRCEASAGNPVLLRYRDKQEIATDYQSGGPRPLVFERFYNSRSTAAARFGASWRSTYDKEIRVSGGLAVVSRPNGATIPFKDHGASGFLPANLYWGYDDWKTRDDVKSKLEKTADGFLLRDLRPEAPSVISRVLGVDS